MLVARVVFILVSWYHPLGPRENPELYHATNCFRDTCETLAGGTPSVWGYGRSLACPAEFALGSVFVIPGIGVRECWDRGGAIECDAFVFADGVSRFACVVDVQSERPLATDFVNIGGALVPFRVRAAFVVVPHSLARYAAPIL